MQPDEPSTLQLHPDLARVVEGARADVGDAMRLQAIAVRLGPQLSAAPAVGAAWAPHVLVGALVAGGVVVAVVQGTHHTDISHVSQPVAQSVPAARAPARTESPRVSPPSDVAPAAEPWVAVQPVAPPEPQSVPAAPAAAQPVQPRPVVRQVASPPSPVAAPAVVDALVAVPAPPSPGDTAENTTNTRTNRAASSLPAPAPTATDPVVQEHDLLAQARRSLDSNPVDSLARVADHQRRFPDGPLSSERELLRILALTRLGRTSEARAARDAFLTRWPTSAYRNEIIRLLGP